MGLDTDTETGNEADRGNQKKKSTYTKWDVQEEIILAQAWETISDDSSIGNNQSRMAFWDRVREYYNTYRPAGTTERTTIQVKNHHGQMLRETNKFVQKFNNERNQRRSGESDDDIYARTLALYAATENKPFRYDHVWRIVKDSPRFDPQEDIQRTQKKTRINESGAYTSSSNPETSVDTDESVAQARPMGQKAAKRKGKGKAGTKDNVPQGELADIWVGIREQEQIKIQQQAEIIRQKDNELKLKHFEILFKDISGMSEQQKKDHGKVCEQIRMMYGLNQMCFGCILSRLQYFQCCSNMSKLCLCCQCC